MELITPYNLACRMKVDQGLVQEAIRILRLKPLVVAKTTSDFDYPGYSDQQAAAIARFINTGRKTRVPKQPTYIDTREIALRADYSSSSTILDIARKLKIKLAQLSIGSNTRYYWTEKQADRIMKYVEEKPKFGRRNHV